MRRIDRQQNATSTVRSIKRSPRDEALRFMRILFPSLIFCIAWSGIAAGQCRYSWIQVQNIDGRGSLGNAINNLGWVAGNASNGGDYYRAFVWRPEVGTAFLPLPAGAVSQEASDINDHGHVVGTVVISGIGNLPYFWNGEETTIIELPDGCRNGFAHGVNNLGQVVGQFERVGDGVHAFEWEDGMFVDFSSLVGRSVARGINDGGVIVGTGYTESGAHAIRIGGEFAEWLPEVGALSSSTARRINATSDVVGVGGYVEVGNPDYRAVGIVWSSEQTHIIDTGIPSAYAICEDINSFGHVVGSFERVQARPFSWQDGELAELRELLVPPAPTNFRTTEALNDAGQIVGRFQHGTIVLYPITVAGDVTNDCLVSIDDLVTLLLNFGSTESRRTQGDLDADSDVDLADLTILLANWHVR